MSKLVKLILKPRFFNLLVSSASNAQLKRFLPFIQENETILDVGSGVGSILPNRYKVVRCDLSPACQPDILASALEIPVSSGSYGYVIHSWVLEHLEDPKGAVSEIYRVLKPGGYLYLTANMAWHIHESPRDYFRFTEYGIRHLFSSPAAWEIVSLSPTLGFWGTLSQLLCYKIVRTLNCFRLGLLSPIVTIPIQCFGLLLEKLNFDDKLVSGYALIARKVA